MSINVGDSAVNRTLAGSIDEGINAKVAEMVSDEIHADGNQALVALINAKVAEIEAGDVFKDKELKAKKERRVPAVVTGLLVLSAFVGLVVDTLAPRYGIGLGWSFFFFLAAIPFWRAWMLRCHVADEERVSDSFLAGIEALREGGHVIDQRILSAIADKLQAGVRPTYREVLELAKKHKTLSADARAFAEKFGSNGKAGQ